MRMANGRCERPMSFLKFREPMVRDSSSMGCGCLRRPDSIWLSSRSRNARRRLG